MGSTLSVSGLTQHTLMVDVYAKVLADNLASLVCIGAAEHADLEEKHRICNRAYAAPCLQRLLPRLVFGLGCLKSLLKKAFEHPNPARGPGVLEGTGG